MSSIPRSSNRGRVRNSMAGTVGRSAKPCQDRCLKFSVKASHCQRDGQDGAMTVDEIMSLREARRMARSGLARALRRDADLTLEEIGSSCGVGPGAVSRWERGLRVP